MGFFYKEEVVFINIYETYYTTTYFGLSIIIVSLIIIFILLNLLISKLRSRRL